MWVTSAQAAGRTPLCLLVAAAVIALYMVGEVECHGFMFEPRSRNWVAHQEGRFWDQMGGNGLGFLTPTTAPPPGVCGDPFQGTTSNFAAQPLRPVVTYTQGQVIQVRVRVTMNHGGRLAFRVCPRSSGWTQDCFDQPQNALTRVDNGQRDFWLMAGTPAEMDLTLSYRLPPTVSCAQGCILQWQYAAMQSCVEPGCNPTFCGAYARGINVWSGKDIGFCSSTRRDAPLENFYNCADVIIVPNGTPVTPPPTTPVVPPPTTPVVPLPITPTPGAPDGCPSAPGPARAACVCQGRAPGYYVDTLNRCIGASWCWVGGTAYQTCPSGLLWSSTRNVCDFPANAPCPTGPTVPAPAPTVPAPAPTVPAPAPTVPAPAPIGSCPAPLAAARALCLCQRTPGRTYIPDVANGCRGAAWCFGVGQASYINCQTGLLFDVRSSTCNWANQVTCA